MKIIKNMKVWEVKIAYGFDDIEDGDGWNIQTVMPFDALFTREDIFSFLFKKFGEKHRCVKTSVVFVKNMNIEVENEI